MPSVSLRLLGAFQILHHGAEVSLGRARLEELVAWLAIHPGTPRTRTQIAYIFWPDSSEKQARTNVRNLIFRLKKRWPDVNDAIAIDRTGLVWRQDAAVEVDVQRFQALHAEAEKCGSADDCVRILTEAVNCYQGDLLPECYDDWALTAREQLRSSYAKAMEQLIDSLLDLRRYAEALERAMQLRNHDPLRESTYRRLMKVYMALGDRAAALRVYHSCVSILQKELGVDPSPATQQFHTRLLSIKRAPGQLENTRQTASRTRLIGRQAEWLKLQQAWRDAEAGLAQCVILWGEAGIGKTRLAEELIDFVGHMGHAWASTRSYAAKGALTHAPITDWLRAPEIRSALEKVDDLWRVELARLLPDLLTDRPELPTPGPLTETWQQQRFYQAIVHGLQAVSGPLLLHLDDMQWSDPETLNLLQFLLHSARTEPLLIVGTIRTEETVHNSSLATLLDALSHKGQLTEIHMGLLSESETLELAQQASETPISPEMAKALYATSEGHPLFLIETLQAGLNNSRWSPTDQETTTITAQLPGPAQIPPKIYSLLSARLNQLSPTAQQVASMAAVIGRAFSYQVLRTATNLDELPLIDALDELWERRIIREQAGDSYDFSHDRIREVAYQEISRARRRLLHRHVVEALESIHHKDIDSVVGELAAHCAQAGDPESASRHYRRAAQLAMDRRALVEVEALLDAALAHAPDNPVVRIGILSELNRVFSASLQLTRWRANLDAQNALLASLADKDPRLVLQLSLENSLYFISVGNGQEAIENANAAVAVAKTLDDKADLARSYQALASAHWRQTRKAEAAPLFGLAVDYAREVGDSSIEAASLEMYAATGMFSGMPNAQILALITRAYRLAEANGDKQKMAELLNKFGYLSTATGMGDFDSAEKYYLQGLKLAREIGGRRSEEILLSNLGVSFTGKGDYRKALDTLNSGLALGKAHPTYWRHLISRHFLGALMMQMGRLDDARNELIYAIEQLSRQGSRHFEVKARCDLGLLHYLAGEYQEAEKELCHVLELVEGHGDLRLEALVSTRLGYVMEITQRTDEARILYERGRNLHEQMGQVYYALNAQAGLARLANRQGDPGSALECARTIWSALAGKSTEATVETALTLRTCYEIFSEHQDPLAAEVLSTACSQLRQRASTIDEQETLDHFWRLPDHRFFQEAAAGPNTRR